MQAISLNPHKKEIKTIEIEIKANTIYSFFNSILIDEIQTLQHHLIYTDANALSEKKQAYFLGEQLLIGDALIIGKNGLEEKDTTIPMQDLENIINYNVEKFYLDALALLAQSDINLYRPFNVKQGTEPLALSCEWVLYTFNIADERTKDYFLTELQKVLDTGSDVEAYIQKMAQLAMNAAR